MSRFSRYVLVRVFFRIVYRREKEAREVSADAGFTRPDRDEAFGWDDCGKAVGWRAGSNERKIRVMEAVNMFHVLEPVAAGPFGEQLSDLREGVQAWLRGKGLSVRNVVQARFYLTDAANQLKALRGHALYAWLSEFAALSFVEQPLLDGRKVALQLWANSGTGIRRQGTPSRRVVEMDGDKYLFHSVRLTAEEAVGLTAEEQTGMAFDRHKAWLSEHGMTLADNCLRTWIYVRDVDRHYAGVVAGRNRVFAREGLTPSTHFIASTGIGGYGNNREAAVAVDFLSVEHMNERVRYLHALDYLNPTHEYGVAFERAVRWETPSEAAVLLSGTASIDRHGECVHRGDVLKQSDRLFLNIEKLLEAGGMALRDLRYAIVYLRDVSDYRLVAEYMRIRFPALPCLIVEARVCRPEWLIEVEGIATTRNRTATQY